MSLLHPYRRDTGVVRNHVHGVQQSFHHRPQSVFSALSTCSFHSSSSYTSWFPRVGLKMMQSGEVIDLGPISNTRIEDHLSFFEKVATKKVENPYPSETQDVPNPTPGGEIKASVSAGMPAAWMPKTDTNFGGIGETAFRKSMSPLLDGAFCNDTFDSTALYLRDPQAREAKEPKIPGDSGVDGLVENVGIDSFNPNCLARLTSPVTPSELPCDLVIRSYAKAISTAVGDAVPSDGLADVYTPMAGTSPVPSPLCSDTEEIKQIGASPPRSYAAMRAKGVPGCCNISKNVGKKPRAPRPKCTHGKRKDDCPVCSPSGFCFLADHAPTGKLKTKPRRLQSCKKCKGSLFCLNDEHRQKLRLNEEPAEGTYKTFCTLCQEEIKARQDSSGRRYGVHCLLNAHKQFRVVVGTCLRKDQCQGCLGKP